MDDLEKIIELAEEKYYDGNYENAIVLYNQAIQKEEGRSDLYESRGLCNFNIGREEAALIDLHKAIDIDPSNYNANYSIGLIYLERHQYIKSIDWIKKSIEIYGESLELYSIYAFLNNKIGNKEEEKKYINLLLNMDNEDTYSLSIIGYDFQGLGRFEQAIYLFKIQLEKEPRNEYHYNNIGYSLLKLEQYEEGIKYLDACIKLQPNFSFAYNNRGYCNYKLGRVELGLADIELSLKMDDSNSYAYKNRGKIYRAIGEEAKAINDFKTALKLGFTEQYGSEIEDLLN